MSGIGTIFRRELAGLFLGPLAWVILCIGLFSSGYFFVLGLAGTGGDVQQALSLSLGGGWPFWALLIVVPPLLTMRMISEEARSGVLEFLLTAPVSDFAVIVGKLLAAVFFMALLLSGVLFHGLLLGLFGVTPDWGALLLGYLGAVLASALFCALGLVFSAATQTPLLAAFLAFVANVALLTLPLAADFFGSPPGGALRVALRQFDIVLHYQGSFLRGVLDTSHAVFFLAWTAFFAFLATRFLEARRWR
ncbi:MAG: ABC transporter permease subunit [Planctomycetes bacterium]|nr:ABC transporter permease subunit [Planctomycetota bacterium]